MARPKYDISSLENKGWEAMKTRLDEEMPVKKSKKRILWLWLAGLAGAVICLLYSTWNPIGEEENINSSDSQLSKKNELIEIKPDTNCSNTNQNYFQNTTVDNYLLSPTEKKAITGIDTNSLSIKSPKKVTTQLADDPAKPLFQNTSLPVSNQSFLTIVDGAPKDTLAISTELPESKFIDKDVPQNTLNFIPVSFPLLNISYNPFSKPSSLKTVAKNHRLAFGLRQGLFLNQPGYQAELGLTYNRKIGPKSTFYTGVSYRIVSKKNEPEKGSGTVKVNEQNLSNAEYRRSVGLQSGVRYRILPFVYVQGGLEFSYTLRNSDSLNLNDSQWAISLGSFYSFGNWQLGTYYRNHMTPPHKSSNVNTNRDELGVQLLYFIY